MQYFKVETLARRNLDEFLQGLQQYNKNAVINNYLRYRDLHEIQFLYYVLMTQISGEMSWDAAVDVFNDI